MQARSGQALMEYVLIIVLIAIVAVGLLLLFRDGAAQRLNGASELECLTPGSGAPPPGHGGQAPGQCRKGYR